MHYKHDENSQKKKKDRPFFSTEKSLIDYAKFVV